MTKESVNIKNILVSISEGLADISLTVEQASTQETPESRQRFFNDGVVHGIEHADQLIEDTIKDLGRLEEKPTELENIYNAARLMIPSRLESGAIGEAEGMSAMALTLLESAFRENRLSESDFNKFVSELGLLFPDDS